MTLEKAIAKAKGLSPDAKELKFTWRGYETAVIDYEVEDYHNLERIRK